MKREEIVEKLKDIIIIAMPNKKEIIEKCTADSNLITDVGLNSVGLLYIVIAVEELFNVSFDDFETVKNVIDYIYENQKDEMDA